MATEIRVPMLGESVVEATVSGWLKREGETVAVGEPLVELETEKVNTEVAAEEAGVLERIVHQEGDTVQPGDVLGVIGSAAATAQATDAPEDSAAARAAEASPARPAGEQGRTEPVGNREGATDSAASAT